MFKSHFTIAWRNLIKDRRFTLLNLTGLTTGLACALLIYIWVNDELRVDRFHKKDARLFQVMENRVQASGIWTASSSPVPMADALAKEMPEVEYATSTIPARNITLSIKNEKNIKAEGKYAGKDFFNLFTYDLIYGTPGQVLADKKSIVVSDVLAMRLFGSIENVIGKTVEFQHEQLYTVTGIFKAPGAQSSDVFDFVLSIQAQKEAMANVDNWTSTWPYTYLLLKPGIRADAFNAKIAGYIKLKTNNEVTHRTPFIKRYSDNYLYGRYAGGVQVGGRIEYVRLFSIIAIFILLIACINFMNLSTAKASGRAKEVGIKKTMGAGRGSLVLQYLGESMLMAFASLALAVALVLLSLPAFNTITGKQLSLQHPDAGLILSALGITLFTGLLAGSYPALYLSGFKPALVLKGKLRSSVSELLVRKGLVVFQFTLSVILIVAVLVVYKQISYIQTKNIGYDRDHIITFFKEGKLSGVQQQETFLAEARNIPGVIRASSIAHSLTGHNNGTSDVEWEGKDPKDQTEFEAVGVDFDMLETLGVTIKEGRSFSRDYPSDTAKIIFNEAAIQFMGLKNPIGKRVKLWDQDMEIAGVVKDFHFQSLHEKVKPLFFRLAPQNAYRFMVRIETGKERAAIKGLQQLYQQFNPGFSFDYTFLDENYQALYAAENRVSILSRYFSGLAILISCLGLFGLAAFTAQRRNKEIGIRKVLGATMGTVVILLSKDLLLLVLMGIIIGSPIAWYFMHVWLQGFAYSIQINWWVFALAGFAAVLIALLTVSLQAIKAAAANPVNSLRSE